MARANPTTSELTATTPAGKCFPSVLNYSKQMKINEYK
jgi:hypothetical protein